jgi:hypothetical protein
MDKTTILLIVNIFLSALAPLITGLSHILKTLEHSKCTSCLGTQIEIDTRDEEEHERKCSTSNGALAR